MMYRISYGPPENRLTESIENITLAADRYCQLVDANALDIELLVEGMPLDPHSLLNACPTATRHFRFGRTQRV